MMMTRRNLGREDGRFDVILRMTYGSISYNMRCWNLYLSRGIVLAMTRKRDANIFSFIRERSAEVIAAPHLERALAADRKLRVKLGVDPTTPYLHLGHVVPLRMLRTFQDSGHQAVLIIGDFTATIGDPSGRPAARSQLTLGETKANERTYLKQVSGILNLKKTEIRHNSEWHTKTKLADFLGLLARFSLKSAWERDDFQKRLAGGKPVQLNEAMYHVLQGYDSVMVRADVELGGVDQRLNILAGRELQPQLGQPPQDIVLLPYLIGLDGSTKMSKSAGNTINLNDSASEMFGKVMSLSDRLIINYAELAAWLPHDAVEEFKERLKRENPRDVKLDLAESITALYYNKAGARAARTAFLNTFSKRDTTDSGIPVSIPSRRYTPLELIEALGTAASKSAMRRLIAGGAIDVDGHTIRPGDQDITIHSGSLVRIGKKKFFRVQ